MTTLSHHKRHVWCRSTPSRINLGGYGPKRLLEVAKKTFRPYTIDAESDKIEWWTMYRSNELTALDTYLRGFMLPL
ncbi:hypothetical protein BJV78DRAFT_1175727 [Lactifluus subvellereus]|nr:hypothetical protein BJV78DRAFT_1175727 [Lactifluus subvellereus]